MLLARLDKKLRFLDLANELAHANTVLLQTTMGAVAVTEQAIINEAHQLGMIVPNRVNRDNQTDTQAAGAYVAYPKRGMWDWIGAIDINSLYPSAIRALNMGPETIVGQLRPDMTELFINSQIAAGKSITDAWEGKFSSLEYEAVMNQDIGTKIIIDWEDGTSDEASADIVYKIIFQSKNSWMLRVSCLMLIISTSCCCMGQIVHRHAHHAFAAAAHRFRQPAQELCRQPCELGHDPAHPPASL